MASASTEPVSRARCFSALLTSLSNGLAQFLSESPPLKGQTAADHNPEKFRSLVARSGAALAHEANKLAIAFKVEPLPAPLETRTMCAEVEQKTVLLLSLYLSLSPDCGKHLLTTVAGMCSGAVAALVDLVKLLQARESASTAFDEYEEAVLQSVGKVWEKCDALSKGVPATNGECCSKLMSTHRSLVSDATKELEDALRLASDEDSENQDGKDNDDQDSFCPGETWSPPEKLLIPPGVGLLKTAAAILKKVAETVEKSKPPDADGASAGAMNTEIDDVTDLCLLISPVADDLCWSLYAPIDKNSMLETGEKLRATLQEVLHFIENHRILRSGGEYEKWGDFLGKALQHNWTKLNEVDCEAKMKSLKVT